MQNSYYNFLVNRNNLAGASYQVRDGCKKKFYEDFRM